jgi:hypothetical protein
MKAAISRRKGNRLYVGCYWDVSLTDHVPAPSYWSMCGLDPPTPTLPSSMTNTGQLSGRKTAKS